MRPDRRQPAAHPLDERQDALRFRDLAQLRIERTLDPPRRNHPREADPGRADARRFPNLEVGG
jgi:hypothetical protein